MIQSAADENIPAIVKMTRRCTSVIRRSRRITAASRRVRYVVGGGAAVVESAPIGAAGTSPIGPSSGIPFSLK